MCWKKQRLEAAKEELHRKQQLASTLASPRHGHPQQPSRTPRKLSTVSDQVESDSSSLSYLDQRIAKYRETKARCQEQLDKVQNMLLQIDDPLYIFNLQYEINQLRSQTKEQKK